jgi:aryl-alcohol dehydrogenase-like predicted oxidoreductase
MELRTLGRAGVKVSHLSLGATGSTTFPDHEIAEAQWVAERRGAARRRPIG